MTDTSAESKCSGEYTYLAGDGTCKTDRNSEELLVGGSPAISRSLLVRDYGIFYDGSRNDDTDDYVDCEEGSDNRAVTGLEAITKKYLTGGIKVTCARVFNESLENAPTNYASGSENFYGGDSVYTCPSNAFLTDIGFNTRGGSNFEDVRGYCYEFDRPGMLGAPRWTDSEDEQGKDGAWVGDQCPDGYLMTGVRSHHSGGNDGNRLENNVEIRCNPMFPSFDIDLLQITDTGTSPGIQMENAGSSETPPFEVTVEASYSDQVSGQPVCGNNDPTEKSDTVTIPGGSTFTEDFSFSATKTKTVSWAGTTVSGTCGLSHLDVTIEPPSGKQYCNSAPNSLPESC
jgi:hypothetical protein